jgi:metal-responsive CopG/Arc/MetJ family transcriptional regulator
MGFHRPGLVAVGAFVDVKFRDYLDRLVEEHGLATRSDAIRLVICEHMADFSNRNSRNMALTLRDVKVKDKHHKKNKRAEKPLKKNL